jgi:hypothetical protein
MAVGLGVTPRQIRKYAKRFEAMGLAVRSPLRDGGGAVLAISPRGLREAGYAISTRTTTSSDSGLAHGRGVSWVAAHCERYGRQWRGVAELRMDGWPIRLPPRPGLKARSHMPDLSFVLKGKEQWAVEFERTPKSPRRLEQILDGYREAQVDGQAHAVLYVCGSESIARLVERVAEEVEVNRAVRSLEWVIEEARGEAKTNA